MRGGLGGRAGAAMHRTARSPPRSAPFRPCLPAVQSLLHSLAHLPEGLEPSPRFLERVAVHYARSLLAGNGVIPGQVPLVLGIWGPKVRPLPGCCAARDSTAEPRRPAFCHRGSAAQASAVPACRLPQGVGKTFTLELCLRAMGVTPVCLSAGELEDEWAGEPGRRLRERYSFAGPQPCCRCCCCCLSHVMPALFVACAGAAAEPTAGMPCPLALPPVQPSMPRPRGSRRAW